MGLLKETVELLEANVGKPTAEQIIALNGRRRYFVEQAADNALNARLRERARENAACAANALIVTIRTSEAGIQ